MADYYFIKDDGILLRVHCQPKAKKNELAGLYGDAIKLRLKAPPVDGKANEEARRFLAKIFGLNLKAVILKSGGTSRSKTFFLKGLDPRRFKERLPL